MGQCAGGGEPCGGGGGGGEAAGEGGGGGGEGAGTEGDGMCVPVALHAAQFEMGCALPREIDWAIYVEESSDPTRTNSSIEP